MTESVVSEPRKRPYHSHVREQHAQETRQRILDVARPLFLSRGYTGTTVDAIAEAASLSPKTVNAIFGSKRGVFAELVHPSAFGEQYQQPEEATDELWALTSYDLYRMLVNECG